MNGIKMTIQDIKEEINKDIETQKNNQSEKTQYPKYTSQSKLGKQCGAS
jgi:hypothetical protein